MYRFLIFIGLWSFDVQAQTAYSDILKVYGDIHQMQVNADTLEFRTNRHLRFFDLEKPLYCQILFWDSDFKGERDMSNALFVRQPSTIVGTTLNFKTHKRGIYEIEFVQEHQQCQIRYTFTWNKLPLPSPTVLDVLEEAFECSSPK